jgi:hypothetical protein
VDYATTNLPAITGQDYVETHGTLEFAAGAMTKSFTDSCATNYPSRYYRLQVT